MKSILHYFKFILPTIRLLIVTVNFKLTRLDIYSNINHSESNIFIILDLEQRPFYGIIVQRDLNDAPRGVARDESTACGISIIFIGLY